MVSMRAKLASRLSMNRVPHPIPLPQCICLAVAVVALRQRRRVQRRNSSRGPLGLREAFAPLDTASQRDEFYHAKQLPPPVGESVSGGRVRGIAHRFRVPMHVPKRKRLSMNPVVLLVLV